MEDNAPGDQPTPPAPENETAPAAAPEAVTPEAPKTEFTPDAAALAALAERATTQRLPAPDEETAARLVQAGLTAGKEDLAAVAEILPKLGWAVAVKGVTSAWPAMKATGRNALIKSLAADESDAARRIRLSIARGLFKVPDVPTCLKLVLGVCKEIKDKESGGIPQRDAQHFANVMIGKGKPWVAQLPLAELKPSEVALLVHCAVIAGFSVGGPPVTPLAILKWAEEASQLAQLDEVALSAVTKAVARWSPKWAAALRKELPTAPEAILAALKPAATEQQASSAPSEPETGIPAELHSPSSPAAEEDDGLPAALKEPPSSSPMESPLGAEGEVPRPKERPVYVSRTVPPKEGRPPQQTPQQPNQQQAVPAQPREAREQREPREQRGPGAKSPQFNVAEVLRQVEAHVGWLKNELHVAEKKLRAREDDRRQHRAKPDVPVIEGAPTPDELARLNVQLEARITELQTRVNDLTADAEARATSSGAFADGPPPEPDAQLRTLLGLKLRDCYADFASLEQQDRDIVIPQHYRSVLAEVFDVLKAEKIPLESEPSEPTT